MNQKEESSTQNEIYYKQKIKDKIFYMMDQMIDSHYNSFLFDIVLLIIQTLQIIGLLDCTWMGNSIITSTILNISKRLLFVPFYLDSNRTSQFQIVFYLVTIFIILLILGFIVTTIVVNFDEDNQIMNQKSQSKVIFVIWDFLWIISSQVLYIPFMQLLISIYRCEKNIDLAYSESQAQDKYYNTILRDECVSGGKIPIFILSIIIFILVYKFCSYINQMYFDARLDCTYKNSRVSGEYEIQQQDFITLYCIIMTIIYEEKYAIIQISIAVFYQWKLVKLLTCNMLHNYRLYQICKLQQAFIVFWTTAVAVYDYFIPQSTITVFFWIFGIVCLTIYNIFDEPVKNSICSANSSNYNYVSEALQQLRILCYAIMRYEQYSLKLDGFLNRHRNDCIIPTCPSRSNAIRLKKFNRMLINQTSNEDQIMSIFVIYTVFNNNILKFRGSNEIRLLYALFLLDSIVNKEQSLIQISFLLQNQPSLPQEFIAFRLKKIILQLQNQKDYKKLDFSSEFTNEEYSNKFKKLLNSTMQIMLQFWQELLEPKPHALNLINKGNKVNEQIEICHNQYEQLSNSRNINQSAIRCYSIFALNILEEKEYLHLLEKQLQNDNIINLGDDEDLQKDEEMYTQGNIIISSQEENFCVITEVNQEISKIVGYPKSHILNKNLNFLIPNIWQQYHNQFIDTYLATGKKKILGKSFNQLSDLLESRKLSNLNIYFILQLGQTRDLFIRSRQDYSIPIKLNVRALPSPTQGLLFQAQISAQNLLYEYPSYIIAGLNGQIDTFSPSAIPMFNIDLKKVKQGMYIEKIIPNFWEYIVDFQQKSGKVMTIKTYQIKMMKESTVKIHVQQIKFMNLIPQGYIIIIKQVKYDYKNQQNINQISQNKNLFLQNKFNKSSSGSSADQQINESELMQYEENSKIEDQDKQFEELSTFNRLAKKKTLSMGLETISSKIQVQNDKQFEFFYDIRSGSFLGTYIPNQNQEEIEARQLAAKKMQKSIFGSMSPQHRQTQYQPSIDYKDQTNQLLYHFIYTSESRNREEEVQDIVALAKSTKQKENDEADSEVQAILENLIKMQYQTQNNHKKLSTKSKKSGDLKNNTLKILPSVYLKYTDVTLAQKQYYLHVKSLIEKDKDRISQKVDDQGQSLHSKNNHDYGGGIKIVRLEKNKLVEIKLNSENEEQNSEESQNLNDEQNLIEQQNENNEGDYRKEVDMVILQFTVLLLQNICRFQFFAIYQSYQILIIKIVQSRKNLTSFLKDRNFNSTKNLFTYQKIFSIVFLLTQLAYILMSLVVYQQQADDTITRFKMYQLTNLYLANTQNLIGELYKGFAIDKYYYFQLDKMDTKIRQPLFEDVLERFTTYQFEVDSQLTQIYLNKVGVTEQMFKLYASGKDILVITHFESSQTTINPTNLYQATQMILAKAYHTKKLFKHLFQNQRVPLGQFTIHNHDVFIMIENFSNQLLNRQILFKDLQEEEIDQFIISINDNLWNLILVGLILVLFLFLVLLVFYFKQLSSFYEVPSILTTIPLSQIRNQIKKCENFINKVLQSEDDDENIINDMNAIKENSKKQLESENNLEINEIPNSQDNQSEQNLLLKNNNNMSMFARIQSQDTPQNEENTINNEGQFSLKGITSQNIRPLNHGLLNIQMLLPFSFSFVLLSIFIAIDSQLALNFTSQLQSFYSELKYSVKLEPEFMLLSNCIKSATIAQNYIGVKQVYHPLKYFKLNINTMYDILESLLQIHYNNYNTLPASYQIQFDTYFSENDQICVQMNQKFPKYVKLDQCNNFLNGIFQQGFSVSIVHLIKRMIDEGIKIEKGEILNPYQETVCNIMYEVDVIIEYLRIIIRELNTIFISGIESLQQNLYLIRIAICISISCILFANFLFITLPLIQQIKNQIFSQRTIIKLIPLSLIFQNRHIRQYILKSYLSNSKT